MKELKLKPHTIVMMIAPSNSGKTYFCENILIPFLESHQIKNKYFSSDAIRRQLLDDNQHKHGNKMQAVSRQAFALLEAGVQAYTSFPVNTDVVIVDATHLTKGGRAKILEIAKTNHYSLVGLLFDYKDKSDYFKYLDEATSKKVIAESITRLKDDTLKTLERGDFAQIFKIDSIDFSQIQISFEEKNNYARVDYDKVCVVGDPHGCLDELLEVLLDDKGIAYNAETNKLSIIDEAKYVHHILIGDFIDKGPQIKEMVEFLYNNQEFFKFVKGNHENWVELYLKGILKKNADNDFLIENWFDSVPLFEADTELKNKFFELNKLCYDFIVSDKFILTHAPVQNKYLGKSDSVSIKKQRTYMYPKKRDFETEEAYLDAREKAFRFIEEEGDYNLPYHVFGHTPIPTVYRNKNKVCIDTGCVMGNYLSTITFTKGSKNPFIKKYKSHQLNKDEKLYPYFRTKENVVDFNSLDFELKNRLKYAALNKVNFIAGTMSPANKKENELESLEAGLEYYKSMGVKKVILQPKFMGSRCQLLLSKTGNENRMFSRNGFEIRSNRLKMTDDELNKFFKSLQEKYKYVFDSLGAERILFDGELLPWAVMGEDMIEREFRLQSKALHSELIELEDTGFYTRFEDMATQLQFLHSDEKTFSELSPKDLKNLTLLDEVNNEIEPIAQQREDLKAYDYQVNIFSQPGELKFQPFSILKVTYMDGKESNYVKGEISNVDVFQLISDQPYAVLDLENNKGQFFNTNLEFHGGGEKTAESFWHEITKHQEMEGIVIKPVQAYIPGVAPYMKVRNPEYLRMTYGMDYKTLPAKHEKLLNGKDIKNKLATSIKEWELGRRLLDIPYDEISLNNPTWVTLAIQLITEQEQEAMLDPRL
jgi:predicted kinase